MSKSLLSKPTPSKGKGLGFQKVTHGGKWWESLKEYIRSEKFLHFFDFPHYKATRALQRIEIYRSDSN